MDKLEKAIYCLENNPVYDEYGITKFTKEAVLSIVEVLKEQQEHEELLTKLGYHWTGKGETLALCKGR